MMENQGSFLFVFSFLLLFDFAVFGDILGLDLGSDFLVFLVLLFESVLGGLVGVVPHFTDDLGDLGNLGIGVGGLNLVVVLLSEEEKGRKSSLGGRWLNLTNFYLVLLLFTHGLSIKI